MGEEGERNGAGSVAGIAASHVIEAVGLAAVDHDQCGLLGCNLAQQFAALGERHVAWGVGLRRRDHRVVSVLGIGIELGDVSRRAGHDDCALQLALEGGEVGRLD